MEYAAAADAGQREHNIYNKRNIHGLGYTRSGKKDNQKATTC
jgi:hypothetical protein